MFLILITNLLVNISIFISFYLLIVKFFFLSIDPKDGPLSKDLENVKLSNDPMEPELLDRECLLGFFMLL